LTKVFEKIYNPFMPKKAATTKLTALKGKVSKILSYVNNINWRKFSSNQVLVVLLLIAAFLIGVLFTKVQYLEKNQAANNNLGTAAPSKEGAQPNTPTPGAKVKVSVGHFPVKGNAKAKVTIIAFADFRCPFCEQFFTQTEPQIFKDYVETGKVKYAFRNFAFLGPASTTAAEAAECANDQGKFWDYYNYLYKNQPDESDTTMYNTNTLTQEAITLGMNGDTFRSCLDGKKNEAKASADLAGGQKAGVSGTPTFFVNGIALVGAQPYEAFKTLIDQELAKVK
jgi:protein-disulfide isomerase